jgi:hypothetical protein
MKLKINNSKAKGEALWEKIPCTCHKGIIMESYPLINCDHCKFDACFKSVPKESFTCNQLDHEGKIIKVVVKEITLKRGSKEDILGWEWYN